MLPEPLSSLKNSLSVIIKNKSEIPSDKIDTNSFNNKANIHIQYANALQIRQIFHIASRVSLAAVGTLLFYKGAFGALSLTKASVLGSCVSLPATLFAGAGLLIYKGVATMAAGSFAALGHGAALATAGWVVLHYSRVNPLHSTALSYNLINPGNFIGVLESSFFPNLSWPAAMWISQKI